MLGCLVFRSFVRFDFVCVCSPNRLAFSLPKEFHLIMIESWSHLPALAPYLPLHGLGYSDGSFCVFLCFIFPCVPMFADVFLCILVRSIHSYVFLCLPIYSDVPLMYSYVFLCSSTTIITSRIHCQITSMIFITACVFHKFSFGVDVGRYLVVCLPVCLCMCLKVFEGGCVWVCIIACVFVGSFVCLCVCLFVCLCVLLFDCVFMCLFVCLCV